jgi:uncharacterized protein YprB with RNaseH-like and TPR domain
MSAASGPDPRFPGFQREGEFLYRRTLRFAGIGVDVWPPAFSPETEDPQGLAFYDTETTGLSGGAGSMIFLFGAAWCEGRDLAVSQLFLSDFPGEPEFLLAIRDLLAPYRAFVSYNGKTFDSHLLRTRFLMNRIEFEPGPQVDLLHHARRLWRSITGDCSLRTIETQVIGFQRGIDVASEDIPEIWLEFLRTGRPGTLPLVFDHNVMDITSLARLYAIIGRLLAGDHSSVRFDERAFGGWLLRSGQASGGAMLEQAWSRGNDEAGRALSLHHKRLRDWQKAVAIWERMLAGSRSIFAAIELAKHHEHRTREPGRALALVDQVLSWDVPLDARMKEEIQKRRQRLRKKLFKITKPV